MENLHPIHDRILVKLNKETNKTEGGIFLPTESVEKSQTGIVIRTGKGRITQCGDIQDLTVKVGDSVYFGKYAGVHLSGDEYVVLKEDEIIGILK